MAIIHFVNYRKAQSNSGMKFVLNYTMQDKKTVSDGKKFVSGINCTTASAYTEFRNAKKLLWSSFFVTLVAKKYRLATMLPFVPRMVCDSR